MSFEVQDDCEKCKHFKKCYVLVKMSDDVRDKTFDILVSNYHRNVCINNEKKNWKSKD